MDAGSSSCGGYDFTALPRTMTFQLGFSTPTNYVNCVNYTLSAQTNATIRGVQASPSESEIEQVTLHMDHPFWESFQEDSPVHWDQVAAQYALTQACNQQKLRVQEVLEFFGQEAVARVVSQSPKLHEPKKGA